MKKKHDIKRRQLIKNIGLATGAAMLGGVAIANEKERKGKEKPVLALPILPIYILPLVIMPQNDLENVSMMY